MAHINRLLGKLLSTIILLCIPLHFFSQNMQQMLDQNYWIYGCSYDAIGLKNGSALHSWHTLKVGDSFDLKGKTYKTMLFSLSGYQVVDSIGLREENGKVYVDEDSYIRYLHNMDYGPNPGNLDCIPLPDSLYLPYHKTQDGELILYDFNMNVGDSYRSLEGHDDIFVIKVDSFISIDSTPLKRITLNNGMVIIESIGCVNSPGHILWYLNYRNLDGYFSAGWLNGVRKDKNNFIYAAAHYKNALPMLYKSIMMVNNMFWKTETFDSYNNENNKMYVECTLKEYQSIRNPMLDNHTSGFKNIYFRKWMEGSAPPASWEPSNMWLGQMGYKIYTYNSDTKEIVAVMDFSLNEGDIFDLKNSDGTIEQLKVVAVNDTVMPGSKDLFRRKVLHMQSVTNPENTDIWIEGIGSGKNGIAHIIGVCNKDSRLTQCVQESFVLCDDDSDLSSTSPTSLSTHKGEQRIFGPDGSPRKHLRPGLNIIRFSDGTISKILIK